MCKSIISSHSFPKHFHDAYEIGFSFAGSANVSCAGNNKVIGPGQLAFFHPGEVNSEQPAEGIWKYYTVLIDEPIMHSILGHTQTLTLGETVFSSQRLRNEFCKFFTIFTSSSAILEKEEALYYFVKSLLSNQNLIHTRVKKDSIYIKHLCNFIQDNFRESFSIHELAAEVNLHQNYIFELFNKYIGISPHQYQNQLRINAAKRELAAKRSVADIAVDLGFYDQSHFHKLFKRATGVSPGVYKQLN